MDYSAEQQAIFKFIEEDTRSLLVIAGAGAGKTTTGVEAAKRIAFDETAAFLAFNKRIAESLVTKLPPRIPAKTFHAFGNAAWKKAINKWAKIDGYKVNALVREMAKTTNTEFRADVVKLVGFAKGVGIVPAIAGLPKAYPLTGDTDENWMDLIEEFDLDFGRLDKRRGVELAREVLAESIMKSQEVIDFNDQLYLPVVFNAHFTQYDLLFVDEAQDVNAIQREIIRRSITPKDGRLIAIGDPNQAIYGFRGAGKDSMELLKREFAAVELPLSVSYRCPINVIKEANEQVDWLKPADGAADGKVEHLYSYDATDYRKDDVILCRLNAPLVEYAFRLIAQNVSCIVLGRDIGAGLVALVRKMKAESIPDLERKLLRHVESERSRLIAEGRPYKINSLTDRVDTIFVFTRQLRDGTIASLVEKIVALFDDNVNPNRVTLSTIHKAKGLEWKRVFILKYDLIGAWSVPGVEDQENNLRYVAKTRAMQELYYIEE